MKTTLKNNLLLVLTAIAASACNNMPADQAADGSLMPSHGYGKMKVVMAAELDSASGAQKAGASYSDVKSATISFDRLDLRGSDEAFTSYALQPMEVDLMNLSPGVGLILSKIKIPLGSYDMIRLRAAGPGLITYQDGHTSAFEIPSGSESGLKIFFDAPLEITGNDLVVAIVRFDVSRSFVFMGNGDVNFKPVLRVAVSATPLPQPAPSPEPAANSDSTGTSSGTGSDSTSGSTTDTTTSTGSTDTSTSTGSTDTTSSTGTIDLSGGDQAPPATTSDTIDTTFDPWLIGT